VNPATRFTKAANRKKEKPRSIGGAEGAGGQDLLRPVLVVYTDSPGVVKLNTNGRVRAGLSPEARAQVVCLGLQPPSIYENHQVIRPKSTATPMPITMAVARSDLISCPNVE